MIDEFNCNSVRRALWDYMAGALGEAEREGVTAHLRDCRECDLHRAEVRSLRTGLKGLSVKTASSMLSTRLQVLASRERSRMMLRRNLAARWNEFSTNAKLLFDNLLRPIAVPAMGGILSSFFCIAMILDTLHVHPGWQPDVPLDWFSQVTVDGISPFSVDGPDVTVQLTVDPNGSVSDFEVPGDSSAPQNTSPAEMREIGNMVLFSTFVPATAFGQRVSGKIVVSTRHINIRG